MVKAFVSLLSIGGPDRFGRGIKKGNLSDLLDRSDADVRGIKKSNQ